jgi:hypothetical protein
MSDFKGVMQNVISRNNKQNSQVEAQQHEMQGNIDTFAKQMVDKIFDQLSAIFPAWGVAFKDPKQISTAKKEWIKALQENNINSIEHLKAGFRKARASQSDFVPSVGKFIAWCNPCAEDLIQESPEELMSSLIRYKNTPKIFGTDERDCTGFKPIVIELYRKIDMWSFNQMKEDKALALVNRKIVEIVKSGWRPPAVTGAARLEQEVELCETHKKAKSSRVESHLKDIRSKLKQNKI